VRARKGGDGVANRNTGTAKAAKMTKRMNPSRGGRFEYIALVELAETECCCKGKRHLHADLNWGS
jgi:hypothetical protein